MPIKDPTIYPPYWKQFSLYIRTERSGGKCEACGVGNGYLKYRSKDAGEQVIDPSNDLALWEAEAWYCDTEYTVAVIVLTVAHLDAEGDVCRCQDVTGFLCANPAHVKAMCQQCHNRYDRPKRSRNAAITLAAKRDSARGLLEASR